MSSQASNRTNVSGPDISERGGNMVNIPRYQSQATHFEPNRGNLNHSFDEADENGGLNDSRISMSSSNSNSSSRTNSREEDGENLGEDLRMERHMLMQENAGIYINRATLVRGSNTIVPFPLGNGEGSSVLAGTGLGGSAVQNLEDFTHAAPSSFNAMQS